MSNSYRAALLVAILWSMVVGDAQAYVDPGSGSVIVTTLLGLFAAVGYTFRKYFYKLKRLLSGQPPKESNTDERPD